MEEKHQDRRKGNCGRKRIGHKKRKVVSFTVDPNFYEEIQCFCSQNDISMSKFMEHTCLNEIRKRKNELKEGKVFDTLVNFGYDPKKIKSVLLETPSFDLSETELLIQVSQKLIDNNS